MIRHPLGGASEGAERGLYMPVENSRLKGFYKLSVKERRDKVAELANLNQEAVDA